ncbi:glycosyltransferase family 2 protein [Labedaea rhizosphaerae]|uniref:Glycosyl transferase family 2 n=1 Tax=Labedaea rhizosphaerae TaxID=598644 RepID=A0A4R6S2S2_LABRH|nr:glycosyltransferase family 2 protein [Labedaea rhizosphaerae]TDP93890.1 glycosyl transferase family 2 [Labedaea rhizosphaerae]
MDHDLLPEETGLTAIVPCYNEGAQVDVAYRAVSDALAAVANLEILFVDDGSGDDTLARIKRIAESDPRVRYLSFTRNFGLPAAVTAAFRYASKPWAVQLDADLQFPPSEIWLLLETAAQGYDLVFGIRRERKDGVLRRIGAAGTHQIARRLLHIEVPQGATSFRVVRTEVGRTIVNLPTGNSHFVAKGPQIGARYTTVPVQHAARDQGQSKFRFGRLAGDAFELLFGFSWRPLNAAYLLCALAATLGVVFAVLGATGVAGGGVLGAAGLLAGALIAGAVGLIGRYLHRRMLDVPTRRRYYVREANVDVVPEDTIDRGVRAPVPTRRPAPVSLAVPSSVPATQDLEVTT